MLRVAAYLTQEKKPYLYMQAVLLLKLRQALYLTRGTVSTLTQKTSPRTFALSGGKMQSSP